MSPSFSLDWTTDENTQYIQSLVVGASAIFEKEGRQFRLLGFFHCCVRRQCPNFNVCNVESRTALSVVHQARVPKGFARTRRTFTQVGVQKQTIPKMLPRSIRWKNLTLSKQQVFLGAVLHRYISFSVRKYLNLSLLTRLLHNRSRSCRSSRSRFAHLPQERVLRSIPARRIPPRLRRKGSQYVSIGRFNRQDTVRRRPHLSQHLPQTRSIPDQTVLEPKVVGWLLLVPIVQRIWQKGSQALHGRWRQDVRMARGIVSRRAENLERP